LIRLKLSSNQLILLAALWMTLLGNLGYYRHVLAIYPPDRGHLPFLLSIIGLQMGFTVLLLAVAGWRPILKPMLGIILIASALAAYFMDSYGIVIDQDMIRNTLETNASEATDLLSWSLLGYLLLLGILPAWLVWRSDIEHPGLPRALLLRGRLILLTLLALGLIIIVFYKPYASFFREHKPVRFYSNPVYFVYSGLRYAGEQLFDGRRAFHQIGLDARLQPNHDRPRLIVVVVGETARADHFSLNGYDKPTNPRLSARGDVISFERFYACGTSTARSVPCMFSALTRENFSNTEARNSDNVLDILKRAGVSVLWLDNNSSSKGVADRVAFEDFRQPGRNPLCNPECRDAGMLQRLSSFIEQQAGRDIVIVLHQMGNHGPAYYKRYPTEFERFRPVCRSNELDQCSPESINNAYDNAILYTDDFLARIIELLEDYDDRYATAMWYVSDHGESLGENGIYLHGLPYFLAPESQTRVPSILWLGRQMPPRFRRAAQSRRKDSLSHDNLFDSLLDLAGVETRVMTPQRNLFAEENATASAEKP
jgi:lipid A ethanolaminephosphotransferase